MTLTICIWSYVHNIVFSASGYDKEFELLGGFPPKPLTDPSGTIASCNLKGARITQKAL